MREDGRLKVDSGQHTFTAAEKSCTLTWNAICEDFAMVEQYQPEFTCNRVAQKTMSSIDFAFTNHDPVEQMMGTFVCHILRQKKDLSDHKPL